MPLASYTSLRTIAAVCLSLAVAVPYPNPQPPGQIAERCYYPNSKSTPLRSGSRLLSGGRDGAIKGEGRACGLTRRYTRQAFFASHKKKKRLHNHRCSRSSHAPGTLLPSAAHTLSPVPKPLALLLVLPLSSLDASAPKWLCGSVKSTCTCHCKTQDDKAIMHSQPTVVLGRDMGRRAPQSLVP